MNDASIIFDFEMEDGSTVQYATLAIFSLNGNPCAALVPLRDNGDPAPADVSLFYCQEEEGGGLSLYEIADETEYNAIASAFQRVLEAI